MWSAFKRWFAKSGIRYLLIPHGHNFQELGGTEMIDTINPFTQVIEDPEHPLARIYREDVWQGFVDTFEILIGNHYDLSIEGKGRKGLLDILILPVISRRIIYHWVEVSGLNNQNNQDHIIIRLLKACILFPLLIPAGIVEIGRGLLAGVLTFVAAPFVIGVHWATANKKHKLEEQIKKLPIVEIANLSDGSTGEIANTLNEWMRKNGAFSLKHIVYNQEKKLYGSKYITHILNPLQFRPQPLSFKTHSGKSDTELAHDAMDELNLGQKVRVR